MTRVCLIVHQLEVPPAQPSPAAAGVRAWEIARRLLAEGREVVVLHTEHVGTERRQDFRRAATALGAAYVHIEEHPLPLEAPLHPAVASQRVGWQLIHALGEVGAAVALFADQPAHAAAPAAARRTGSGLPGCRIAVVAGPLRERERERRDDFPTLGRDDIADDFLERKALADADAAVFSDPETLAWARERGWALPADTTLLSDPLPAESSDSAASAEASVLPSVAVCMPYFEQPRHLAAALADIAAQTAPPAEVIVVDDGSRSAEAIEAFDRAAREHARPGWTFVRQENAGPAAARNRAAAAATADAVLFCDTDNRYSPRMVETLARAKARTGADAVACAFHAVREGAETSSDPGYLFLPLGGCLEMALIENSVGDTNTLVDRRAFLEAGGFPGGTVVEDWRCYLELLRRGRRLEVVPAVLFTYQITPQSRVRQRGELTPAAGAVKPFLERSDPVWTRLWPHLAGLVRNPRLAALEAEAADLRVRGELASEAATAAARRLRARLLLAERERRLAEGREREARERLEHGSDGERARIRSLEQERRRLEADLAEVRRQLGRSEDLVRQREAKVARLQDSFSWRVTAPLRALRRTLIDRMRRPEGAPAPAASEADGGAAPPAPVVPDDAGEKESLLYHYFIDSPHHWRRRNERFAVRGWCFYEDVPEATGIRAVAGGRVFPGTYGLSRHDIAAIMPDWPQAPRSGFRIEVELRDDDQRLDLELRDGQGRWRRFVDIDLGAAKAAAPRGSYEHWVAECDTLDADRIEALRRQAPSLPAQPLFSILMPVYNTEPAWLRRAIESVRSQAYGRWELCIADDASTDPRVGEILERAAAGDARIKVRRRERNGHICRATNTALEMATGDYCVLFDHDDELRPHALYCLAQEVGARPGAELIYSDEDKIDEFGQRDDPHFKPDWNPDLLRSQNYLCHVVAIRTATLREAGGMREGFEGSQDWDLFLRLSERVAAASIRHVPRVLYHWRSTPGSTALSDDQKDYAAKAARRALAEHCARTGVEAELERAKGGHWRLRRRLPSPAPLVSIVIPTRNAAELVELCIASLFAVTDYAPLEVLLVDNNSDDPRALALFDRLAREDGVRVLRYEKPFNYSAINNHAVGQARGEVLCLLNNDIEVLHADWLAEMVSQALRPEIGAVGARLLFPDRTVQHAGVITGLGGIAGHAFKRFHQNEPGHQFRPHLVQNLSAVTAACLVIRRSVYEEVGGFDEAALPVAFNDVDFCLRVQAKGYRNLYTPFAEMLHHESATRGSDNTPEKVERFRREIEAIRERWGDSLLRDPAYNPNFSLDSEDFALAYPPRLPPLVEP